MIDKPRFWLVYILFEHTPAICMVVTIVVKLLAQGDMAKQQHVSVVIFNLYNISIPSNRER